MSRSQITFSKKEREKKKQQKKQQKLEKREFNKTNNDKGKSLEELFAYVDANGNISDTPPSPEGAKKDNAEWFDQTADSYAFGKVSFYNNEGRYGFIRNNETKESVYFNDRLAGQALEVGQRVKFKFAKSRQGVQVSEVIMLN